MLFALLLLVFRSCFFSDLQIPRLKGLIIVAHFLPFVYKKSTKNFRKAKKVLKKVKLFDIIKEKTTYSR